VVISNTKLGILASFVVVVKRHVNVNHAMLIASTLGAFSLLRELRQRGSQVRRGHWV
jgi:hypothetical protein